MPSTASPIPVTASPSLPVPTTGSACVDVVIITHNHRQTIARCLQSVRHQTLPAGRIVMIDNASNDGTPQFIATAFPDICLVVNNDNRGFAAACNQGIALALQNQADYIALLNPDTLVHPDWLKELLAAAQQAPDIGLVQSLLFEGLPPSQRINSRGNCQQYLGFGYCDTNPTPPLSQDLQEIAFASGAACLLTKQLFMTIGGFDERYFLYHEDLDLGHRARLAGFRVVLAPRSLVWHQYRFDRGPMKFYYLERNRLRTLFKHYQTKTLTLLIPIILLTEAAVLLRALLGGWGRLKLKSYLDFIKDFRELYRTRQSIQSLRKLPDRAIIPYLTSQVHQKELDGWALCLMNLIWSGYWRLIQRWV